MAKRNKKQNIPAVLDDLDDAPLVKGMDGGDAGGDDAEGEGDDEDEDGDDEEDDDDDGDGAMGKSMPGEADLIKSMNDLAAAGNTAAKGGSLRKSELAEMLARGEDLSKSEAAELTRLVNGPATDEGGEELRKSHRESFLEDTQLAQGVEVSEFLDAQTSALTKSLDDLRAGIDSSGGETKALLGQLAKGLQAVGMAQVTILRRLGKLDGLTKSMNETVNGQPEQARGRTSRIGQPFNDGGKPATNGQPNQQLRKGGPPVTLSQIGDTLDELIKSTEGSGSKGFGIVEGVDLVKEVSKFESTKQISAAAMRIVVRKRGLDPAALGL